MMDFLAALQGSAFSIWLRESGSLLAYPTVLTLHTYGLGLLVGAHWALALRLLGVASRVPLGAMERLFRWMWIGFAINLITGLMLFAADATHKAMQVVFWVKLAFVVLGLVVAVRTRSRVFPIAIDRAALAVPLDGRMLAQLAIVFWIGAIVAGRLMAYL